VYIWYDVYCYQFCLFAILRQVCDSSVGIVTGYGLDDRGSGVQFPAGAGNFSLHHHVQNGSGPPSLLSNGYQGALSLEVKRPEREADHSPPSSAEVKNAWGYTFTLPIQLHGTVLS
jgi:hypothetical protein